ncbi:MAG: cytochrome c [Nitrospirae bacterium]|nr:cytochrome c [Nitrospirota bacterium]
MYPIWEVPNLTAGIILAVIATFHILPSHLSTSAMWFNVYIETKAYKEDKPELLEFIRKYSLLLLVFAYVTGSLSGIGIWYAATVANPRGISGLIHNYVWGWATEWVFFIIEVTGILMVVIVGILAFMLSPGKWIETGNFFDGFFNKTYWSQLLVRTTLMFAIAAVYAIAAAARLKNEEVRKFIIKTASKWGLAGLLLGGTAFFWYLKTIPAAGQELIQTFAPQGLKTGIIASFVLLLFYFIYANLKPLTIRLVTAVLAIAVLFAGIWSTERMREIIRKPYVISQYMYSNQIIGNDIASKNVTSETNLINQKGILAVSPFVPEPLRVVNDANMIEAGKLIARIECLSCHTLDKSGLRPMPQMVERRGFTDAEEMKVFLEGLDGYAYMPPFMGKKKKKNALANYLVSLNR